MEPQDIVKQERSSCLTLTSRPLQCNVTELHKPYVAANSLQNALRKLTQPLELAQCHACLNCESMLCAYCLAVQFNPVTVKEAHQPRLHQVTGIFAGAVCTCHDACACMCAFYMHTAHTYSLLSIAEHV